MALGEGLIDLLSADRSLYQRMRAKNHARLSDCRPLFLRREQSDGRSCSPVNSVIQPGAGAQLTSLLAAFSAPSQLSAVGRKTGHNARTGSSAQRADSMAITGASLATNFGINGAVCIVALVVFSILRVHSFTRKFYAPKR